MITSVDLRWRNDDDDIVHRLTQTEKSVMSGRGSRMMRYWIAMCGLRSFTQSFPPPFVDVAATCMTCIACGDDVPD